MRIIVDTDPGMGTAGADPEDGMAILYALRSPGVIVEGITLVQGNVPVSHSWPNTRRLLELAGRTDISVHAGAAAPRDPDERERQIMWLRQREQMGGQDDVPPTPENTATRFLIDTVLGAPGEITIVAIGPLTNLAAAIEADAGFAPALAGLVIMGGTVEVPGNITPAAEFNIWMDPAAAAVVFDSGAPITMVGLDVCHQTRFGRAQAEELGVSGSALAGHVAAASEQWMTVRAAVFDGDEELHLYDTLAMAAALESELVEVRPALVEIETSTGPAEGMTVVHLNDVMRQLLTGREPNARVATGVDLDRFEARFAERVIAGL